MMHGSIRGAWGYKGIPGAYGVHSRGDSRVHMIGYCHGLIIQQDQRNGNYKTNRST